MSKLREGQAVTVGAGGFAATYVGLEEDADDFDAAQPTRDCHWVQFDEGEDDGLYPRSEIVPTVRAVVTLIGRERITSG